MDVAERLFAERGIDAVSLRTINTEAGYSVAALHYPFSTRDGLIRALLARAQPPMLQQRAAMLAALNEQKHPSVEQIVEALIRPLTVGMLEDFPGSLRRLRFLVRLSFDRSPYMTRVLEESLELFLPLLRRTLPEVDTRTLTRRWLFAADLTQHALANLLQVHLESASPDGPNARQFERFVRELGAFIVGGLRAPCA
jgi:AcrR family transcriptional regulator